MKFKVGDLITGTSDALEHFNDIDLSDQAVLEVTSIDKDDNEYYCKIVSNEVDDENVGINVCIYEYEEEYFVLKQSVKITSESWLEDAEKAYAKAVEASKYNVYTPGTITTNTSSRLSSTKLLKAKGLI